MGDKELPLLPATAKPGACIHANRHHTYTYIIIHILIILCDPQNKLRRHSIDRILQTPREYSCPPVSTPQIHLKIEQLMFVRIVTQPIPPTTTKKSSSRRRTRANVKNSNHVSICNLEIPLPGEFPRTSSIRCFFSLH
jgi:hypothetical protein